MPNNQNTARVAARISPKIYQTLSRAAELTGSTLNQFLVNSAYEKAQEIIEKERFIKMSERTAEAFFNAIEKPPQPTLKLIKAVKSYKKSGHGV